MVHSVLIHSSLSGMLGLHNTDTEHIAQAAISKSIISIYMFLFNFKWLPRFIHIFPDKRQRQLGKIIARREWNHRWNIPFLRPDHLPFHSFDRTIYVCVGRRWGHNEIFRTPVRVRSTYNGSCQLSKILVAKRFVYQHLVSGWRYGNN